MKFVIIFCILMQLSPQYDCVSVLDNLHFSKESDNANEIIPEDSSVQTSSAELNFLKENLINWDSESREEADGHNIRKQSKAKPPLYMKLVYDKISEASNYQEQLFSVPYNGLLLRAWLPLGITRESSSNFTVINFQQTSDRRKLGNFLQAQIILTLKDNIEVSMKESIKLHLHLDNKNVSTELLDSGTHSFYSFNITDYLNEKLAATVKNPIPVSFKVTVSPNQDGNVLEELFDVQVEQPFIMFRYEDIPESFFPHLKKSQRTHRRRQRSLGATVTATQQTKATTGQRLNITVLDLLPVNDATNNETFPNIIPPNAPASTATKVENVEAISSENPQSINSEQLSSKINITITQEQLSRLIAANERTIVPTSATNIRHPPPLIVGNKTIPTIASILPTTKDCCRRYQHFIRPDQVDWFDVIEPKQIDIGYCSGQCAYPIENGAMDFHLHTMLLDRFRLRQEVPSNYPRSSSCVPVTYLPKSTVEVEDDGGMVIKVRQDVLVHTCGCR